MLARLGRQALPARPVLLEPLGCRVLWACPDLLARQDPLVSPVPLVLPVSLALPAQRV